MKQIAIIGCGYVGTELAKQLGKKGFFVTCTTRNKKKLSSLNKVAQHSAICRGSDEKEVAQIIKDQDVIVVTVSADSMDAYKDTYLRTAQTLRHFALEKKKPKTLIYTSSTAVYGDQNGYWVDENSPLSSDSDPIKVLIETEDTFLSLAKLGWKVCVLRLGEIYGPKRDLVRKVKDLQDHVVPGKGDTYTNMVHLQDIVGAADYAITHSLEGVYNLADDDHPIRKDLFEKVAEAHRLKKPVWDPHLTMKLTRGNKRVSNHKIKSAGYVLKYPHRVL
ncbi:MAG TPA: SDR family oxidoreductase [Chlamydiales bacterium]|nr:SDR family oxidoreductase [Chlamydiales bacterium]